MKNSRDIIKKPIITEKSMVATLDRKYTFEVIKGANKTEVKQAIEDIFGVEVQKVNILNRKAKQKRLGKYIGKTNNQRKAVVTLKETSEPIVLFPEN